MALGDCSGRVIQPKGVETHTVRTTVPVLEVDQNARSLPKTGAHTLFFQTGRRSCPLMGFHFSYGGAVMKLPF